MGLGIITLTFFPINSFLLYPMINSISSFVLIMVPILVEVAEMIIIAEAEFSPKMVYSFTGIEFPFLLNLL